MIETHLTPKPSNSTRHYNHRIQENHTLVKGNQIIAADAHSLIGTPVGNYTITRKIGEGGMGTVYLAEHPLIGKKVALKVLHSEFSRDTEFVSRFFNEARAVNDIQHPNIVDIIDYGSIPGANSNMVYFIMEYLNGASLEDIILQQAPIDPNRCLQICYQAADALAASHRANIVHRDLKPDNIILVGGRTKEDFVKLLDFGIAKLTGERAGPQSTRTGMVMGTPAYMSPEQCEGKGEVDQRTDIYALGIVLYQLLSGRVPFLGEGYGEVIVQHLTKSPTPLSQLLDSIPFHIEAVCMKALEKKPEMRYQRMEEFMEALLDPVGFVESNGGLSAFYSTPLRSGATSRVNTQSWALGVTPSLPFEDEVDDIADRPAEKSRLPFLVGCAAIAAAGVAVAISVGDSSGVSGKPTFDTQPKSQLPGNSEGSPTVEPAPAPVVQRKADYPVSPPKEERTRPVRVSGHVFSNPRGAAVWSDGDFLGITPARVTGLVSDELPVTLTLKKPGYEDNYIEWHFNPDQRKQRYRFKTLKMKRLRAVRKGKKRYPSEKSDSLTPKVKPPEDTLTVEVKSVESGPSAQDETLGTVREDKTVPESGALTEPPETSNDTPTSVGEDSISPPSEVVNPAADEDSESSPPSLENEEPVSPPSSVDKPVNREESPPPPPPLQTPVADPVRDDELQTPVADPVRDDEPEPPLQTPVADPVRDDEPEAPL